MSEREQRSRQNAPQPNDNNSPSEADVEQGFSLVEGEDRQTHLTKAVRQLLDALDRCAGDPPDCPHCGPARTFAQDLLKPLDDQQLVSNESGAEQERLSLTGRVGADPTFRTTPKGTLIGRFPLAVHQPDNSTIWWPVLALNARAEKLRDALRRANRSALSDMYMSASRVRAQVNPE